MWNLPPPDPAAALGHFDEIAGNNPDRQSLRSLVERRYALYAKHAPARRLRSRVPPLGTSLDASARSVLKSMYRSGDRGSNGRLKSAIRAGQTGPRSGLCPYCGIGPPVQWDHVLPKTVQGGFPELAVLNLNLVKVCGPCNTSKDEVWKPILHTYWDAIDQLPRCVSASISVQGDAVAATFELERHTRAHRALYRVLETHCTKLHLLDTWSTEAQRSIAEARAEYALAVDDGHDRADVLATLQRKAQSLNRLYGPNYWEGILYAALADSTPFLDLICR